MKKIIEDNFKASSEVKLKCIEKLSDKIIEFIGLLIKTFDNNNKVIIFGNGGSAADAQHFTGELMGHFSIQRKALPAIALSTDTSVLTCIANDFSYKDIFSRQLEGIGNPKDLAIGMTTSGNSENVIEALKTAKEKGLSTVAFTGVEGGKAKEYVDILINVPSRETARIQEAHITILHAVCHALENTIEEKTQ